MVMRLFIVAELTLLTVADDAQLMQEQMNMGGMGATDINKVYQSEKENLELVKHEWDLENVEQRLLKNFVPTRKIYSENIIASDDSKKGKSKKQ